VPGDDLDMRREMLREAERVIDHEVQAIEQLDAKTSHALTLAISGITLLVALGTLAGANVSRSFLVVLALAGVANGAAVHALIRAYHGLRSRGEVSVGPSPVWLADGLTVERSLREHLDSVLLGYRDYHLHNQAFMSDMKRSRAAGIRLLVLAAFLYGVAALRLAVAATFSY
jgi:hypothetical protein